MNADTVKKMVLSEKMALQDILGLPRMTYMPLVSCYKICRKKAKLENGIGFFTVQYARLLSAIHFDRSYIDSVMGCQIDFKSMTAYQKTEAYFGIGWCYCNLGFYDEGIEYMKRAIDYCENNNFTAIIKSGLAVYISENDKDEALTLIDSVDKYQPKEVLKLKIYVDNGDIEKAGEILIKSGHDKQSDFSFFLAEYYFAKNDFSKALEYFDKCRVDKFCLVPQWRIMYDYKKALTYYYTNQARKCYKQAIKIKKRKKWDKFYRLEDLKNNLIKREPFIDEIISSDTKSFYFLDFEKINQYYKTLMVIFVAWVKRHPYLITVIFVILIAILIQWLSISLRGKPQRFRPFA